jgi:hypothetical protein
LPARVGLLLLLVARSTLLLLAARPALLLLLAARTSLLLLPARPALLLLPRLWPSSSPRKVDRRRRRLPTVRCANG